MQPNSFSFYRKIIENLGLEEENQVLSFILERIIQNLNLFSSESQCFSISAKVLHKIIRYLHKSNISEKGGNVLIWDNFILDYSLSILESM